MTESLPAAWYGPLFTLVFALKLALVCGVVYVASFAARRFGHGVAGTLSGLPMIAGPIMGFVLSQSPADQAHAIALATLTAYPAMVAHMVVFARASLGRSWWVAWAAANAAFLLAGAGLLWLALPFPANAVLAAFTPWVGLHLMPSPRQAPTALHIPAVEMVLRVAAAGVLATVLILGAAPLPAAVSGLLLSLPITGNVLPCFTQARHGPDATVELLRGFLRGMAGFLALFIVLAWGLPALGAVMSYVLGWAAALVTAYLVHALAARRRHFSDATASR